MASMLQIRHNNIMSIVPTGIWGHKVHCLHMCARVLVYHILKLVKGLGTRSIQTYNMIALLVMKLPMHSLGIAIALSHTVSEAAERK